MPHQMPSVDLSADGGLHSQFQHEWWYFFAELRQASTGARFHYTTALMRNHEAWVSYYRWWRLDGPPPAIQQKLHFSSNTQVGTNGLTVRPGAGWSVFLGAGEIVHHVQPVSL